MYKAASRKIGFFLTGFILLVWVAVLQPSLCRAGMHELSDGELSSVYAAGFSSFDLNTTTGIARMDFNTVMASTYTTIDSLKMGYYGTPKAWDQAWLGVSLGSPATDLVLNGVYIEAKFTDITNSSGSRQLDYVHIGTPKLTGDISANFTSFSGTILGTTAIPYNRSNLGTQTITSDGSSGFYLTLDKNNGFSFNFGSGSHL